MRGVEIELGDTYIFAVWHLRCGGAPVELNPLTHLIAGLGKSTCGTETWKVVYILRAGIDKTGRSLL